MWLLIVYVIGGLISANMAHQKLMLGTKAYVRDRIVLFIITVFMFFMSWVGVLLMHWRQEETVTRKKPKYKHPFPSQRFKI